ncbi:hypothetical protein SCRDD08_00542 [Streptococcus cristatus]|uniref:Uncharacterized protein n=1 Tax=Streptococcus cristatus TaxID=45634 RepID=A0A139N4A0_STRCR|nr:hypothetical protein SCRDD08_00542 [Streptococcus cristatus]
MDLELYIEGYSIIKENQEIMPSKRVDKLGFLSFYIVS